MAFSLTVPKKYTLGSHKDQYIELWTRELRKHPKMSTWTVRQRRVVASLWWDREVAKSNEYERIPPPPVVGLDARNRTVVQRLDHGKIRMWALTKDGDPADITEPVHKFSDGTRVEVAH